MVLYKFLLSVGLLVAIVVLAAAPVEATTNSPNLYYKFTPVSYEEKGGAVTLDFTVEVCHPKCAEIEATVVSLDGVEVRGIDSWVEHVEFPKMGERIILEREESPSFTKTLHLWVPPDDTSSVMVTLACQTGGPINCRYFFVTTGDTMEFNQGQPPVTKGTTFHIPGFGVSSRTPPPATAEEDREGLSEREMMEQMQETPLEDASAQFFKVDGQVYRRDKGERIFRPVESMTAKELNEAMRRQSDSLRQEFLDSEHDVVLRITEDRLLDTLRCLTADIKKSEVSHEYSVRVSGRMVRKLREAGVEILSIDGIAATGSPLDSTSPAPVDTCYPDSATASPRGGVTVIFEEHCSLDWQNQFSAGDSDQTQGWGDDYWGHVWCDDSYDGNSCASVKTLTKSDFLL